MYNNKIRKFRESKNKTLKELANEVGISAGYLSHLERGSRSNPSKEVMEKIADALDSSIATIFFSK